MFFTKLQANASPSLIIFLARPRAALNRAELVGRFNGRIEGSHNVRAGDLIAIGPIIITSMY